MRFSTPLAKVNDNEYILYCTILPVHEQSRPDRDDHVDVLLKNVAEGQADQFEIKKNVDVANTGLDVEVLDFFPPFSPKV